MRDTQFCCRRACLTMLFKVENLDRKLSIYTESANGFNDHEVTESWRKICQLEAESVPFILDDVSARLTKPV